MRLDRPDILWSPLRDPVDYPRAAALAFVAEVLENALPDRAPEDDLFRLALTVSLQLQGPAIPLAINLLCAVGNAADGLAARSAYLQHHRAGAAVGGRLLLAAAGRRDRMRACRGRRVDRLTRRCAGALTSRIVDGEPLQDVVQDQGSRSGVPSRCDGIAHQHWRGAPGLEERLHSARALATIFRWYPDAPLR